MEPIRKDKLFFFGAYEGQRELIGAPATYLVPTTASLGGNVANSLTDACNSVAAAKRNPLSLAMAGMDASCTVVSPQANLFQSGTSLNYVPIVPLDTQQDNALWKTDYHINERHNLSGEYYYSNYCGLGTQNQIHDYWRTSNAITSQIAGMHWTWTPNPALVNEARFGMNRVAQYLGSGRVRARVWPGHQLSPHRRPIVRISSDIHSGFFRPRWQSQLPQAAGSGLHLPVSGRRFLYTRKARL